MEVKTRLRVGSRENEGRGIDDNKSRELFQGTEPQRGTERWAMGRGGCGIKRSYFKMMGDNFSMYMC